MKKLLLYFLFTIYSIAAIGVELNLYYCCNQLDEVAIAEVHPHADRCGGNMPDGCCGRKEISIKLKADQQKKDISSFSFSPDHFKLLPAFTRPVNIPFTSIARLLHFHWRPPPLSTLSRQSLFCVFII